MKFLINLFFVLSVAFSWDEAEIYKEKYYPHHEDRILIFNSRLGEVSKSNHLIKKIEIYDNEDLKGKPILYISNEGIQLNNQFIKLEDLKKDKSAVIEAVNLPLKKLLVFNESGGYINFHQRIGEKFIYLIGSKKLVFKFNKDFIIQANIFDNLFMWRALKGANALKELSDYYKRNKNFRSLIDEMKGCVKNRSQACLTSIYNQDLTFNLQGYFARLDPVVCKTRNDFGSYDTQKLKQLEPLPWSDMSKMLSFNTTKGISYVFHKDGTGPHEFDFLEIVYFDRKEGPCRNILPLTLEFKKIDSQWKLELVYLYDEREYDKRGDPNLPL